MRFVGIISFSVYLWHLPVIFFFQFKILPGIKTALPPTLIVASILIVIFAVSSVSYLLVEKQFMKMMEE